MPAQVWPLFGVEPSSLRPVPRVLDSHFPPLLGQKRATKQDSTCKAKFSAAQRKRRPLKFKQPRGCGTGGQRRSAGQPGQTLLRPPPRSSSIPQLLPVSPDPGDRRSPRAPTHANTYQRASSGSTIPLAAAPQAPTSWQPRPAPAPPPPPQGPPPPLQVGAPSPRQRRTPPSLLSHAFTEEPALVCVCACACVYGGGRYVGMEEVRTPLPTTARGSKRGSFTTRLVNSPSPHPQPLPSSALV